MIENAAQPQSSQLPAVEPAPLVAIVSRCAWTLYNFRLPLLHAIAAEGRRAIALGQPLGGFERSLADEGVTFQAVPVSLVGFNPLDDLRLLSRLVRLFRRIRPIVVHAFTVRPAIFATLAARIARVPVRIVTITGLGHAFTTAGAGVRWVTQGLYCLALKYADVVFFQNPDDRALFVERGLVAEDKTRLIPGSGIDLDRFAVRPLPEAHEGVLTFVMIARLLREKGVSEYLEAVALVKQEFPAARFILVGGADTHNPTSLSPQDVQAIARNDLVQWMGEVADVRPFIEASHVVVLPSYREGVPRSLLEGAAMARALLATDVPGCREVVAHGVNGLLVPPRDAQALAAAMRSLLLDRDLVRRLASAARRKAETVFDQRFVIQATLRAYDETLRAKSARNRAPPSLG
jgi:glycosyltransferase involved in cell wall biosynthesis